MAASLPKSPRNPKSSAAFDWWLNTATRVRLADCVAPRQSPAIAPMARKTDSADQAVPSAPFGDSP